MPARQFSDRQWFSNSVPTEGKSQTGGSCCKWTNCDAGRFSCVNYQRFACAAEIVQQVTSQHEIYYKYPLTGGLYRRRDESKRTEPLKHFGVGLFGVNSHTHRQHRQLLMPAFHKQRIESYRDDIVAITQSVLEQLQVDKPIDISQLMRLLTLRVATKTLFGADVGEEGGSSARLLQKIGTLLGSSAIAILPYDLPGLPFHRLLNLMAQLDDEMRTLIRRKQTSSADAGDVLSMLIQARDAETGVGLTEDELLGHVSVIFAAGHETSANALTWTLFYCHNTQKLLPTCLMN